MAMDFKPINPSAPEPETQAAVTNDIPEVQEYDIVKERQQMSEHLANSREIEGIVSSINAYDVNTVVTFGHQAAEEISRCSDQVLSNVNMRQIDNSGTMLVTLGKVMDKFDMQEIVAFDKPKGLFGSVQDKLRKQLDKLLAKYNTLGGQIDKIYVQLKEYEQEIKESNKTLDAIFNANVNYYQQLLKYILAGEQAVNELDNHIAEMKKEYEKNQDNMLQMDIVNMEQVKTALEQRIMDLRMSEHVAMQSIPMIRSMQFSNVNLIRKINSAFIITLPVFKQAITQAVLLKRQRIQAEAMSALDERTNEMLLKNAKSTAAQTKMVAQLSSDSSIKIQTLEKTWQTIMQGIEDTKRIQEDAKIKRQEDTKRLNELKMQYEQQAATKI